MNKACATSFLHTAMLLLAATSLFSFPLSAAAQESPPAGRWEAMPGQVHATLAEACNAAVGRIRAGVSSRAQWTNQYRQMSNAVHAYSCEYTLTLPDGTATQGWAGPVVNLDLVAQRR